MHEPKGLETRRIVTTSIAVSTAVALLAVAGCEQWARMEENQIKLQAMAAANARQLATISSQLHTGHGKLQESIQNLDQDTQEVAAGVLVVQNEQRQLHEAVVAGNKGLKTRITQLEDNQHSLQGGLTQVADVTGRTASDLTALAGEHTALHEAVRANQQELTESLSAVAGNQQRIETGITHLQRADEGLASDIAALADKHDATHAAMEQNQHDLRLAVDGVAATTNRTAAGVTELGAGQAAMQETIRINRDVLTGQMAASLQNQQALQSQVDALTAAASQTALDLTALDSKQAALQQNIKAGNQALAAQVSTLAENQQALQTTLVDRSDDISTRVALLAERQETFASNLDILLATAGQTALDVLTFADGQADLQHSVHAGNEALTARMTTVAANQQQIQNSLETVAATTSQASLDVTTLGNGQTQLEETLVANRQELTSALAAIAQNQQNWLQQFETTRATAQAVAENLTALEGRMADLQAVVQTSAQDVTARLGTDGQQRQQFEAQVSQDIQAMYDAIAQLRQVQAALQEQMTQVQKSTESQAENIKAAIEQMQRTPETNSRIRSGEQSPAEIKVSDAARSLEAPATQTAE